MRSMSWTMLLLAACGSVEVPPVHYYRLALSQPSAGSLPSAGVLRVADLRLHNNLSGDALMVADGPVRLQPWDLHRWIAPLDRMVTDALVLGLSRTRIFELVKGSGDPGGEDLWLQGRILDFQQRVMEEGSRAEVGLELWLTEGLGGRQLFRRELHADVPCPEENPEKVVAALSRALGHVQEQLLGAMAEAGVFVTGAAAKPGR